MHTRPFFGRLSAKFGKVLDGSRSLSAAELDLVGPSRLVGQAWSTRTTNYFRNVAQKPSGNASQLIDSQSKNHTTTIE